MIPHISEAIHILTDGASFKVHGDTYEDVEWEDEENKNKNV
jgi:hypothetical protein